MKAMTNDLFVEVDYFQRQKNGNEICGDVFLTHKIQAEKRTLIILSDGLGSGVKANILASMTASMALNFMKVNAPIAHTAKIIMSTLPVDSFRKISFSSFTIVDIVGDNRVTLMEYGNPLAIIWKNGRFYEPEKKEILIAGNYVRQRLFISSFEAGLEDRIVLFSDGVSQSGMGNVHMPFGWNRSMLCDFVQPMLEAGNIFSAGELARKIISRALQNDAFQARDDMSCGAVFFRQPRKILVCTGPPYKKEHDEAFVERFKSFNGQKIVCGGTTAQILSRMLNKEVTVKINSTMMDLPPESEMEGADLVTEGILTIGKVSEYMERHPQLCDDMPGPAGKIIHFFNQNDEISFLVGTKVNGAHQDPSLPVELEIRRNVIKKIARLLQDKFLKKVEINYI